MDGFEKIWNEFMKENIKKFMLIFQGSRAVI